MDMRRVDKDMAFIRDLRKRLALYLVTDDKSSPEQLLTTVRSALEGGVTTVQLRRKHDDGRKLVKLGHGIRELTKSFGALYIVNDRVDIALLTQADGVHVGQSDISCRDARRLLGDKLIGVSTCTLEEAKTAERDGADYLGVGAVFPTRSKSDADMCGLDGLAAITQYVSIPVVGIGGIALNNVKSVVEEGADGVAAVSAILHAEDPRRASVELKQFLT
jgi:thiamine-phosphate pyrophosphorylase